MTDTDLLAAINKRFDATDNVLASMNRRFDSTDAILASMSKRFDSLEQKVDVLFEAFDDMKKKVNRIPSIEKRLTSIEGTLGLTDARLDRHSEKLNGHDRFITHICNAPNPA